MDDPADTFHVLHEDASGAWVGSVVVERGSRAGPWHINGVILRDRAGNTRVLETHDLEQDGFPSSVEVTSTPDTSRPSIVSFRARPRVVDTRRARQLVTFTAKVADPVPGVGEVDLFGSMPGASIIGFDGDFVTLRPVPGSSDTFRASVPVRRAVGSGIWKIRRVSIQDKVGNFRSYSYDRLGELGFSRQLRIVSRVDARPPRLARFALRPGQVDVRSQDGRVVVRARAVDLGSGVQRVSASVGRRLFVELDRVTGTGRDGVWKGAVTLPRCTSLTGEWRVSVFVTDRGQNGTSYGPAALDARGWTQCRTRHGGGPFSSEGERELAGETGRPDPRALLRDRLRDHARERDPTPGLCAPQRAADLRAPRSGNMGVQEAEW